MTWWEEWVVELARLERSWIVSFPVLDEKVKGNERREGQRCEGPRIWILVLRRSSHTNDCCCTGYCILVYIDDQLLVMDIRYNHPSFIHVLRACQNDDAADLIALGGDHSVDILLVVSSFFWLPQLISRLTSRQTDSACQLFASFHIGSNITALAWSPTTVSPTASDDWLIE